MQCKLHACRVLPFLLSFELLSLVCSYFLVDNLSTSDIGVKFASSNSTNSPNNLTKDNSFRVKPGKRKAIPICTGMLSGWAFTQWGTFRFGKEDKDRVPFSVLCSAWNMTSERDMGIGLCSYDKLKREINRRAPKYRQASLGGLTFECYLWEDKKGAGYFSWHFIVKVRIRRLDCCALACYLFKFVIKYAVLNLIFVNSQMNSI